MMFRSEQNLTIRNNVINSKSGGDHGLWLHHSSSATGSQLLSFRNNIIMNTTGGVYDEASSNNGIASADYNCFNNITGGDHYSQVTIGTMTEGVSTGWGGNSLTGKDIDCDPGLVDGTINFTEYTDENLLSGANNIDEILNYIRTNLAPANTTSAIYNTGDTTDATDLEVTDGLPDIGAIEL